MLIVVVFFSSLLPDWDNDSDPLRLSSEDHQQGLGTLNFLLPCHHAFNLAVFQGMSVYLSDYDQCCLVVSFTRCEEIELIWSEKNTRSSVFCCSLRHVGQTVFALISWRLWDGTDSRDWFAFKITIFYNTIWIKTISKHSEEDKRRENWSSKHHIQYIIYHLAVQSNSSAGMTWWSSSWKGSDWSLTPAMKESMRPGHWKLICIKEFLFEPK